MHELPSNKAGNLPPTTYKNVVSERQSSWRIISDIKQKTKACYSRRLAVLTPLGSTMQKSSQDILCRQPISARLSLMHGGGRFLIELCLRWLCRKEFNIEGLGLLSSERPVCKGGPQLASGNMDFRRVPTNPYLMRVAHCASRVGTSNVVYAVHLLSFGEPGIFICSGHTWPAPSGHPGHWVSNELPRWTTSTHGSKRKAGRIKRVLRDSTGRGLLEVCACFPPDSTPRAFSLGWLCFVSFRCTKSYM